MSTKDDPVSDAMQAARTGDTNGPACDTLMPCSAAIAAAAVAAARVQVCAKPDLDAKAHNKCISNFNEYEACAKRVASGSVRET